MSRPKSLAELAEQIEALVTFTHDGAEDGYSHSADALWKVAALAFDYAAAKVGATGFQASFAALRFYGEAMHVDCPYSVFKAEDCLYPQYDLPGRLRGLIESDWREWLTEQARKRLDEYEAKPTLTYTNDDGIEQTVASANPRVVAHWRSLVRPRAVSS